MSRTSKETESLLAARGSNEFSDEYKSPPSRLHKRTNTLHDYRVAAKGSLFSSVESVLKVGETRGYTRTCGGEFLHWLLAAVTAFLWLLIARWFPKAHIRVRYHQCPLREAEFVFVVLEDPDEYELVPVVSIAESPALRPARRCRCSIPKPSELPPLADRMFLFRHTRFVFNTDKDAFEPLQYLKRIEPADIRRRSKNGLSGDAAAHGLNTYGRNELKVDVPSYLELLWNELFTPFLVFQVFSIILWCFEKYYIFAVGIACFAVISVGMALIDTHRNLRAISALARFESEVRVLRSGRWQRVSSLQLVPGDIVELEEHVALSCDVLLLNGMCVVNESMLTGESVPVIKSAFDFPAGDIFLPPSEDTERRSAAESVEVPVGDDSRSMVYAATRVLQAKPHPRTPRRAVLGLVVRTGFATVKGSLVLSIMWPKALTFKFVLQSYKFIAFLFGVAAVGFFITLGRMLDLGAKPDLVVMRGLDLVTIIVPPSLPLAMTVGANFALYWLRVQNIVCTAPSRINMSGKVKLFAFDKTGTLTSDQIEVMGVRPIEKGPATEFGLLIPADVVVSSASERTLSCMASCHSLVTIKDELFGDPLEISMFQCVRARFVLAARPRGDSSASDDSGPPESASSLGSALEDDLSTVVLTLPVEAAAGPVPLPESGRTLRTVVIGVRKLFEFDPELKRMSVVAADKATGALTIFCKGAPENIRPLCKPDTVPPNFETIMSEYARKGYRVIALSAGPVAAGVDLDSDRDVLRASLERDLDLLGLVVLANQPKLNTSNTIRALQAAQVRCVMITGDNPLTALAVARQTGVLERHKDVYLSRLVTDPDGSRRVEWVSEDDPNRRLNPDTLLPPSGLLSKPAPDAPELAPVKSGYTDVLPYEYELAVTGDCYEWIATNTDHRLLQKVVVSTQVFSRMSPGQKTSVVLELQHMGMYVGMCGDGANDCSALRSAYTGISLSETEASIAAPFTYADKSADISCVPILLREGRASLATSFQLFFYMGTYSMNQFSAVMMLYWYGTVFGDLQYLYQDAWIVLPFVILMGNTRAADQLSAKRPSGDLFKLINLSNLFSHVIVNVLFQALLIRLTLVQPDYVRLDNPKYAAKMYETTSMFYFCNFQLITMAFLFSLGHPWKKPIYSNIPLSVWFGVAFISSALILARPDASVFLFKDDVKLSDSWRLTIGLLALANILASLLIELVLFPGIRACRRHTGQGYTAFGPVRSGRDGKLYHELRREFEDGWRLPPVVGGTGPLTRSASGKSIY